MNRLLMSLDDMARFSESWNVFGASDGPWLARIWGDNPLTKSNDPSNAFLLCLNQERG